MEAKRIAFTEFRDWLLALDAERGGQPPDLVQWWELKARLGAVDAAGVASSPTSTVQPTPAPVRSSSAPAQAETQVEDFAPAADLDPEPGDFRALSRQKDGGLSAEAVDILRRPAPPSRGAP